MAEQVARRAARDEQALTVYDDFQALPEDVARLFNAAGRADFQSSLGWFMNFTQTVELGASRPRLYVWRVQGQAVAVLPMLRQRGAGGHRLSALGNYYSTRFAPVGDSAALAELLRAVLRQEAPVHELRLLPLEAGSTTEASLRGALRAAGCAVFAFHCFQNWLLPVQGDWPSYLAARDGKLRTTLARMGKRFATRGGRLELVLGEPDLDRAIAAYETVYAASWKTPEPHPRFMPGLIRAAARGGQLRMAVAWLREQPVAAQVWMVAGGRADIYKLAHDERHKETSPGTLLTALLMQHVFESDRVTLVDYLSGDDAYKRLWMSEVRERRGLVAYNLRTRRGLAGAARETLGRMASLLLRRRTPA